MSSPSQFLDEKQTPWVTYLLLVVLTSIFFCERVYAVNGPSFSPSVPTLISLGGLNRLLVVTHGEWYRLFTGPLQHSGFAHLFFNGVGLYLAGIFLERLVGPMWFFALFTIGALCGSLMSIAINNPTMTSVGASGALMALFGAMYVCSFRLPQGPERKRLQMESLRILLPTMMPFMAIASAHDHIDCAAHLGGMISGIVMGIILLSYWPEDERWPSLRYFSATVASAGIFVFIASGTAVTVFYPHYQVALSGMIPETQMPKNTQERTDMSSELIKHYPRDPRSHIYRAQYLLTRHDSAGAKREMTTGLDEEAKVSYLFGPKIENLLHAEIAAIWLNDGNKGEAREQFKPICSARSQDRPPAELLDQLAKHLCD